MAGELDFSDDTLGTGDAVAANACVTPGNTGVGAAAYRDAIAAHAPSEREDDREHGRPTAFHGQPVHPLPPGETFAGIVVPTAVRILLFSICVPARRREKHPHGFRAISLIFSSICQRSTLPRPRGCTKTCARPLWQRRQADGLQAEDRHGVYAMTHVCMDPLVGGSITNGGSIHTMLVGGHGHATATRALPPPRSRWAGLPGLLQLRRRPAQ